MTEQNEAVSILAEAKTGDTVWVYDENANNYVDGIYVGRGAWQKAIITDETRLSFTVGQTKYDRTTGIARPERGYSPMKSIYGQREYEGKLWAQKNRYDLVRHIDKINDINLLQEIARITGYKEKP